MNVSDATFLAVLHSAPEFDWISEEGFQRFIPYALPNKLITVKKHDFFTPNPANMYFIHFGELNVIQRPGDKDRVVLVRSYTNSDVYNFSTIFVPENEFEPDLIKAYKTTTLIAIPKSLYIEALMTEARPGALTPFKLMCKEYRKEVSWLTSMWVELIPRRIELLFEKLNGSRSDLLFMTREYIAARIGASREMVGRIMNIKRTEQISSEE